MNDLAPLDAAGHRARLRQRFIEEGETALLDHELVEYLLTLANRRGDTKALAKRLLAQFGVYANDGYATYGAMSFTGLYVDRQQPPEPRGPEGCTVANTGAYLLDGDPLGGDPVQGIWNRAWSYEPPPHCGLAIGFPACDKDIPEVMPTGLATTVIHIADFLYLPGDQSLAGDLGAPVQVTRGDTITFVNEDAAGYIRHTITSCKFPCNGPYVANYPHADGMFHSGKLGNFDPIDGGGVQTGGDDPLGVYVASDTVPVWQLDTSDLEPGYYAYYCMIHPWMRGWIEIVDGEHTSGPGLGL